jgi:hypothetical protein
MRMVMVVPAVLDRKAHYDKATLHPAALSTTPYLHAALSAAATVKNVIVSGANATVPAATCSPFSGGSASSAASFSVTRFSSTSLLSNCGAESVYRIDTFGTVRVTPALPAWIARIATPPGIPRRQCA